MAGDFTRRRLLELAGASSLAAAAAAAARAEGTATGPRVSVEPVLHAHRTPVRIGAVSLVVRDLERVSAFYRDVIGLAVVDRGDSTLSMGADGVTLLVLTQRAEAAFEARGAAGLYHTAFLMPTRRDLARWVVHVAVNRVRITGFADHLVSEAFYLDDPEGNGVEVYADRAPDTWRWEGGAVVMATDQLDIEDLVSLTNRSQSDYASAPSGMRIGHVHLRVGDIEPGQRFYSGLIGLDPTRQRNGASFLSSGRYHHHLALNTWQSRGAGRRDPDSTGLGWFSLEAANEEIVAEQVARLRAGGATVEDAAGGFHVSDPWGTGVRLLMRPA